MGGVEYAENDLKYIRAMHTHPDPVLTAPELAKAVAVTQQAAYNKLSSFHERGIAKRKKVGSKAVVWWLTTVGTDIYREEFAPEP